MTFRSLLLDLFRVYYIKYIYIAHIIYNLLVETYLINIISSRNSNSSLNKIKCIFAGTNNIFYATKMGTVLGYTLW